MCIWTANFYAQCSHAPLILQTHCDYACVQNAASSSSSSPSPSCPSSSSSSCSKPSSQKPTKIVFCCKYFTVTSSSTLPDICPDCQRLEELRYLDEVKAAAAAVMKAKALEVEQHHEAEIRDRPYHHIKQQQREQVLESVAEEDEITSSSSSSSGSSSSSTVCYHKSKFDDSGVASNLWNSQYEEYTNAMRDIRAQKWYNAQLSPVSEGVDEDSVWAECLLEMNRSVSCDS